VEDLVSDEIREIDEGKKEKAGYVDVNDCYKPMM
jgi:hypothetical protein